MPYGIVAKHSRIGKIESSTKIRADILGGRRWRHEDSESKESLENELEQCSRGVEHEVVSGKNRTGEAIRH